MWNASVTCLHTAVQHTSKPWMEGGAELRKRPRTVLKGVLATRTSERPVARVTFWEAIRISLPTPKAVISLPACTQVTTVLCLHTAGIKDRATVKMVRQLKAMVTVNKWNATPTNTDNVMPLPIKALPFSRVAARAETARWAPRQGRQ